jgi:hypothetical protein
VKRRSATILGLAVNEHSILCAQVTVDGASRTVRQLGLFVLEEGRSFDAPAAVGEAFAAFLAANHFTATRAVVGVPARWLIAQEKEVPPVGEEEAKTIVRLHAERMGSAEKGALAVDAAGRLGGSAGGSVLVVAMLQKRLDQVHAFGQAAGLTLAGVTSTSLVVSDFIQPASHALVMLGERGAELVVRRDGSPRVLRHLGGAKATSTATLAPELRRSLMSISAVNEPLIVCDATGDNCAALEQQFGVVAQRPTLESLSTTAADASLNGAAAGLQPGSFVPAVALAVAGADEVLPIDYTRSRLAPRPARRFSSRAVLGMVLGGALLAGLIAFYVLVTQAEAEAESLARQLEARKPEIAAAETLIDRTAYGRTFFETRTPTLDCLRELAEAFNYDERIYVSSFLLNGASEGELKGRATEERLILALADRLKGNKRFSQVQLGPIRETGSREREFSFSISFQFMPEGVAPATRPAAAAREGAR